MKMKLLTAALLGCFRIGVVGDGPDTDAEQAAAAIDPALAAVPTTTIAVPETGPVPSETEAAPAHVESTDPAAGVIGPGSFLKRVEVDGEKDLKALDEWFDRHFHPSMWPAEIHGRLVTAYDELKTLL